MILLGLFHLFFVLFKLVFGLLDTTLSFFNEDLMLGETQFLDFSQNSLCFNLLNSCSIPWLFQENNLRIFVLIGFEITKLVPERSNLLDCLGPFGFLRFFANAESCHALFRS